MIFFVKAIIFISIISCIGYATVVEDRPPKGIDKVAICHKGKTIYINKSAVKAHLRHGDYMGICR
jgi:hypothetical protein